MRSVRSGDVAAWVPLPEGVVEQLSTFDWPVVASSPATEETNLEVVWNATPGGDAEATHCHLIVDDRLNVVYLVFSGARAAETLLRASAVARLLSWSEVATELRDASDFAASAYVAVLSRIAPVEPEDAVVDVLVRRLRTTEEPELRLAVLNAGLALGWPAFRPHFLAVADDPRLDDALRAAVRSHTISAWPEP